MLHVDASSVNSAVGGIVDEGLKGIINLNHGRKSLQEACHH